MTDPERDPRTEDVEEADVTFCSECGEDQSMELPAQMGVRLDHLFVSIP